MVFTRFTALAASAFLGALCVPASAESVFVSSGDTDSVLAYDAVTGEFQMTFASGGGLDEPEGVTFGPDGNFYVTSRSDEVLRYDGRTGAFLNVFASGNGLVDPAGLAFGGPDDDLFVSSGTLEEGEGGNQILRFDGATGAFEAVLDPANTGGLDDPEGVRFGADGLLYVNSAEAGEVLRYDPATNAFVDKFVSEDESDDLADPTDLIFGPDGDLLVSSAETSEVKRYDATTGEFVENFIEALSGGLDEAEGMAFGPNGNLLVVSELGDAVLEYDGTTGAFVREFVPEGSGGLAEPTFITTGATPIPLPPAAWSGMLTIGGLVGARVWRGWRRTDA